MTKTPGERKQAERDRKRESGQKLCQYWLTDQEKKLADRYIARMIKKRKVEP